MSDTDGEMLSYFRYKVISNKVRNYSNILILYHFPKGFDVFFLRKQLNHRFKNIVVYEHQIPFVLMRYDFYYVSRSVINTFLGIIIMFIKRTPS